MLVHRNAKTTPKGRALIVQRVETDGWTVTQMAAAFGVSVRTVHKWRRRYRDGGAGGLLDGSSVPRRMPRLTSPARVAAVLGDRSEVELWGTDAVVEQVVAAGPALASRVHAVAPGDAFTAAGFAVEVLGGWHAVIHEDIPRIANTAFLVDGLVLHPGDSFTVPAGFAPEVLLVPVGAPWLKLGEAVDYARNVGARLTVPIHEALLSSAGIGLIDRQLSSEGVGVAPSVYRRLDQGEPLTVPLEA